MSEPTQSKESFFKELMEARDEMFKEYDSSQLKKMDRITRLGRCKAFDAGFAACANLWALVQYPEPEAPVEMPDVQPDPVQPAPVL